MTDRRKHDVPIDYRIGSPENYIIPAKSRVTRQGLANHMPKHLHLADFSRCNPTRGKGEGYGNVSTLNMLSVPTLKEDELRLGLFLFEYAVKKADYKFVFCLGKEDFRTQKIGDGSGIHINRPKSSKHIYELMPFVSLIRTLKINNARIKSDNLMPMLRTLESFGILTLTEVNDTSCVKPDTPKFFTNCVFIELNEGFETAPINRKWLEQPV